MSGRERSRIGRLTTRLRGAGIAATCAKAFRDHVFHASDSVIVEYRRGWRAAPTQAALPAGLTIVTIRAPDTVPPLCAWMAWRRDEFAAMLAAGRIGVFLIADGIAIGCAWCTLADHHDRSAGEHFRVGPGEAYHYCWMLDPVERRGHAGIALLRGAMVVLDTLGIERQFGVVDIANRASYLVQYRFGYRECGQLVTHYRLFGRRWARLRHYAGTRGPVPAKAAA